MAVEDFHLHLTEHVAVEGLQRAEQTDVEQALAVLQDAVDVVAEHAVVGLFLKDAELVAVVAAKAVTGGNPNETIAVEVYLVDETAGQLFVGFKQFACLGISVKRVQQKG